MSDDSIRDTVAPKSDQMNADDLIAGPQTYTITEWRRQSDEKQPVALYVTGRKVPYLPCKSMRRVLMAAWGEYARDWVGKSFTLYCDQDVVFGGVKVGGIRISHMSDMEADMNVLLTASKGKRAPYVVRRLVTYDAAKFADELPKMRAAIAAGKSTIEKIVAHCEKTAPLTASQMAMLTAPAVSGTDDEVF